MAGGGVIAGAVHDDAIYGAAYRLLFSICDPVDHLSVINATTIVPTISLDEGAFSPTTNAVVEIAEGLYYLDLTGLETLAQRITVVVSSDQGGIYETIYPQRMVVLESGTAQGGNSISIVLAAGASASDNFYNGLYVREGTDLQARKIITYDGSTKQAVVEAGWETIPSGATTYDLLVPNNFQVGAQAVWGVQARTLSSFGTLVAEITTSLWSALTSGLTVTGSIGKWILDKLDAAISSRSQYAGGAVASVTAAVTVGTNNDKTGYALTNGERTAIANEVEAQIIDETDSEKVLTAITNKIAAANPDLSGLTLGAIAQAVWTAAQRRLTDGVNIVLAKGVGLTGFNDLNAAEINAQVDLALADYDAPTRAEATADKDAIIVQTDIIKAVIVKVNTMLQASNANFQFTVDALALAPTPSGGTAPTAVEIRQEMDLHSIRLAIIESKTNTLGVGITNVVSPVTPDGKIDIIAGDDYLAAIGRSFDFAVPGSPNLTGATLVFRLRHRGATAFEKAAVILVPSGLVRVRAELTRTETAALEPSSSPFDYKFEYEATLSGGSDVTVKRGTMHVSANYPAAS